MGGTPIKPQTGAAYAADSSKGWSVACARNVRLRYAHTLLPPPVFRMQAEAFVTWDTLMIMAIGLFAFVMDSIGGVFLAKFLNLFRKEKINPMIGAAGISAFPMSSRVIQKMAQQEDPTNILLMHAAGANVSGQVASVIAGGLVIKLVTAFL